MKSLLTLLLGLSACQFSQGAASSWYVWETARDNGHLLAQVEVQGGQVAGPLIRCDESRRFQEIEGFGGALTEASGYVLAQLPAAKRAEVIHRYYDPAEGIGYTIGRTHINSCDFSFGNWALDETAGDFELKHFSLAPMRKWTLPLIKDAQLACGTANFRLLASPWSPPAWMKTNGKMTDGGQLRADCRDVWARYYVRFIEALRDEEKIPVWALTVQNEPEATQTWESCRYSATEERDFVRDHLGPTLKKAGMSGIRLLGLDHNRDLIDSRADALLGDQGSAQYLYGLALHWYVSEDFAASGRVVAKYPDKKMFFTEGCVEGGSQPGAWGPGERYGRNLIGDLGNSVSAWIDWNIALDLKGGPNHVGNFCDAPVLVDTVKGEVRYQSSFYYIGHFSRFVKPGAHRIASEVAAGLQQIAFVNPDGSLAVVVMNLADQPVSFGLQSGASTLACRIPAHAIQTYLRATR